MDLKFYNPYAEVDWTSNRLPHRQQGEVVQTLTMRLGDSLPNHLLRRWEEERAIWLEVNPPPHTEMQAREYSERFEGAIERWLDRGHGSCLLRDPKNAARVGSALHFFDGTRCRQLAWVVMPNHLHAVFVPLLPWTVAQLIHSWKGFTTHEINAGCGREGLLWQKDYRDRMVRDFAHFCAYVRYIRRNPQKARLQTGEYLLWESEIARSVK